MSAELDIFNPSSNWKWSDLFRTLLDFTARSGLLQPQDDMLPEPIIPAEEYPSIVLVDELPYDWLERKLSELGLNLHDRRQHVRPKGSRGTAKVTRQLKTVTALCWHQMAAAIDNIRQCLSIPAHSAVLWSGDVILLHPILAYLYHGHSANLFSIGIEIACRAAGIEGMARTFWRRKSEKAAGKTYETLGREMQDIQVKAALLLGEYYIREVERQKAIFLTQQFVLESAFSGSVVDIPGIVAQLFHRNAHKSRTSDGGQRQALQVVKPLCDRFGHEYGGPVVGSGTPTPEIWGGEKGVRYSRGTSGLGIIEAA